MGLPKKQAGPLDEVWCECCYKKTAFYRVIDFKFTCEFCITNAQAAGIEEKIKADPVTCSDEDWELPANTWYQGSDDGGKAA